MTDLEAFTLATRAVRVERERYEKILDALRDLLRYAERQQCPHEQTVRRGFIWTFCTQCGKKWAEDEGGFTPDVEPVEITKARAAIKSTETGAEA